MLDPSAKVTEPFTIAPSGGRSSYPSEWETTCGVSRIGGESPRRNRLRTYFELFEMAEHVLQYAAEFQLAFQIEKEYLVVFRPMHSAR